jgi:hypothetical protein
MDKFEFHSGPDTMTARLNHFAKPDEEGRSAYISFHGKGPRGGWVGGPMIRERYMDALDDMIAEAKGWPFRCKGCGRAEDDCSADPCDKVIADREA